MGPECQLTALLSLSWGAGRWRVPWVLGGAGSTGARLEFVPPPSLGPRTASPMLFAIPHPATCRATSQSHFPSLTPPAPPTDWTHILSLAMRAGQGAVSHSGLGSDPRSAAEAARGCGGEGDLEGIGDVSWVALWEWVGAECFLEEGPRACPTGAPGLSSCLL